MGLEPYVELLLSLSQMCRPKVLLNGDCEIGLLLRYFYQNRLLLCCLLVCFAFFILYEFVLLTKSLYSCEVKAVFLQLKKITVPLVTLVMMR